MLTPLINRITLTTLLTSALFSVPGYAQPEPISFGAKGILALSDADLTASALADGNLYKARASRDALSVITFPLNRSNQNIRTITIPNSALLYDKATALTRDGRFAFILEGRGALSDSVVALKGGTQDYPVSGRMFIVDLADPARPLVRAVPGSGSPTALAMHPEQNILAVAFNDRGKEIRLMQFDNTGKPIRVVSAPSPVPDTRITDISWHPRGQFLAYILGDTQEVGLMKYTLDGQKPTLTPHGQPVKIGALPATGQFTPDGAYYLVSDVKKDPNAQGSGKGELFVVKFSTDDTPGEPKVVSQRTTGESPEAVAISPDGSLVVVANAVQSYQPFNNPAAGKSALTIYTLSKEGELTQVNEYPFDGVLPQSVAFDKSGSAIAVAVHEYMQYGDSTGGVEFWKVNRGNKPTLEKMPARVSVPRGCHTIKVF